MLIEDLLVDVAFHLSESTDADLRGLGRRAEAILANSAPAASASHNSGERLPQGDQASAGAET